MKHLIREIHRRSLWQVLAIYLAGSWIIYQVVLGLTDGLGLPDWVPPLAIVLFLVGLPIVIATAFVQEGGPSRSDFSRAAAEATEPVTPADAPRAVKVNGALRPLLNWPRALLGGVLAFALLSLGTVTYMGMRVLGIGPPASLVAAGMLDARDKILISDFSSTSGDTALAAIVTEAFRVDFSRSTMMRVATTGEVRDALLRMGRSAVESIDAELAREVAVRDGIKAIVEGEVASTAGAYVLTTRLVAAESGAVLAAQRETAKDSTALLRAIDRLSRKLRERTGESLKEVRRGAPLEQVITPSLEALRKYTEAGRAQLVDGDAPKAMRLLEEAIALDSGFASAHRSIAVNMSNRGRVDLAMESNERALRFPERLTERERFLAEASSHMYRQQPGQAIAVYELMLERFPVDRTALNNIALNYGEIGDRVRAVRYYRQAIAADTGSFFAYANLAEQFVTAGEVDSARVWYDRAVERAPTAPWPAVNRAVLPATIGDYAGAEAALRQLQQDTTATRQMVTRSANHLVAVLQTQGRFRDADALQEQILRGNPGGGNSQRRRTLERAARELYTHQQPERAALIARDLLPKLSELQPGTQVLLDAALLFAWLDSPQARVLLDRYATPEQRAQPWAHPAIRGVEGLIALAGNDVARALQEFRGMHDRLCLGCEELLIARAHELSAEPDSTIAAYERFLATPSIERVWVDRFWLGSVYERLGHLHETRGHRDQARQHYGSMVRLWQNADPELQPRVRDALRALERLTREPGGR